MKFIAIDTNPWRIDDLYACVLLKVFDAPGCGTIVVTDDPNTLANATWVINSKVFNTLNAKFAEELEIDPIPADSINTSRYLWSIYGRAYLTRKAQQMDPLCSERTRTETVDYVYAQIEKLFNEHMSGKALINGNEYMAFLYHGVKDDRRKMEKMFNDLVIDRMSFFNQYVDDMYRQYKEIFIVKQCINNSRNDKPLLILPRGGLPVSECPNEIKDFKCMIYPNIRGGYGVQAIHDFIDDRYVNRCLCDLPTIVNTDNWELVDNVRVEFVHSNKFMAVVHGELEDVKVFAKNHFN